MSAGSGSLQPLGVQVNVVVSVPEPGSMLTPEMLGTELPMTTAVLVTGRPSSRPSLAVAVTVMELPLSKDPPSNVLVVAPAMGFPSRFHCHDTVTGWPSTSVVRP